MLIDALNLFTRHFTANPTMSSMGEHVGGIVGFLGTLTRLIERDRPEKLIVVWEGGGSTRRRALYSEYKMRRRPIRLNRFYDDDIPNTVENRDRQVKSIVRCLTYVPVCQVYVSDCEADDIIAYFNRTRYAERQTIIVSSDRDYYQLLNESTRIFRPGKKVYVTQRDVVRDFGVTPVNFALAKAVCGDESDNIPGVRGVSFKTLVKRFPKFTLDEQYTYDDFMHDARTHAMSSRIKAFHAILQFADDIKRNLRLVDLNTLSMMSPEQRRAADYQVDTFTPNGHKIDLIKTLVNLGIVDFNVDDFYHVLTSTLQARA